MRTLVIGGSGFVGRNLTRRLITQGSRVTVLDRNPDATGTFTGEFVAADAQDPAALAEVITRTQPDTIYHLAANSDISAGIADAALDFGDTLMTTVAVAEAVRRHPVPRLVFASSSAIFGSVEGSIPESPEQMPRPASNYGKAKLASEWVLDALAGSRPEMTLLLVRFPNVVGPLATHGVVFDFVRKLRRDPGHLQVLGDGRQTKPYVHVDELLDGIAFFLERSVPGANRVNVGPPDVISVRDIVREVTRALGAAPEVTYQDSPFGWPGDVPRYEFDTSRMREAGFMIETSSAQAVHRAAVALALEHPEPSGHQAS